MGDVVRLKPSLKLGRESASIVRMMSEIEGGVVLDKRIGNFKY